MTHYDVVIVGGAAVGSAAAYFLAAEPRFNGTLLVLEQDFSYQHCATTLSVASIRHQFSTPENIRMSMFGTDFVRDIAARLAVDDVLPEVGFHEGGYLFLASPAGLDTLRANHRTQRELGADVGLYHPAALQQRFPWLYTGDLAGGALGHSGEGWLDAYSLMMALRRKATSLGAIYRQAQVVGVRRQGARVQALVLADGSQIGCGTLINTAGTGATAVQCIPTLARDARELFVFQRTPSSIDVRNNHAIDSEEFARLNPGWQRRWVFNFATLQTGGFADEDYVKDGWTDISKRIRDRVVNEMTESGSEFTPELVAKAYTASDDEKMEEIRARVDEIVRDAVTAAALKPWYQQLCKRPCFHDEYLQAYNVPTCHLIDTDGKGVERIDETGVWAGGKHYALDCLIFASGFEVGTGYARRAGYETVGRDGETLSQHWSEGMQTLHGMHVHGFPNLFILGMTQAGNLISNITSNLNEAAISVGAVVAHAIKSGADQVEVTAEGEKTWVDMIENSSQSFLGNPECTPGYYNNEGRSIGRREKLNAAGYPGGPVAYFEYIDAWRRSGTFAGLEFRKEH